VACDRFHETTHRRVAVIHHFSASAFVEVPFLRFAQLVKVSGIHGSTVQAPYSRRKGTPAKLTLSYSGPAILAPTSPRRRHSQSVVMPLRYAFGLRTGFHNGKHLIRIRTADTPHLRSSTDFPRLRPRFQPHISQPVNAISLPALVLAAAVVLDFLTLRYRPAIFERFYRWWLRLSEMNLNTVGERGVRWFSDLIDRVFGRKVLSARSVSYGTLFVFGSILAVSFATGSPGNLGIAILISAGALVPGLINFEGARLLIHILSKRATFARVLLFGLASFFLAEITVILGYASLGLLTAFLVKLGYSHHLAVADAVPVLGILLVLGHGLTSDFLIVAVFPAICCILVWTTLVVLYLSAELALRVRHFLANRIEQKWDAPFMAIGAVIAGFVTLGTCLSNVVDVKEIALFAIRTQSTLDNQSGRYGATFGTWTMIRLSDNKSDVAKYYNECGKGLKSFLRNGIPTPAEIGGLLRAHLPNLARQWNKRTDTRRQHEADR
jgi:hypothetical protein